MDMHTNLRRNKTACRYIRCLRTANAKEKRLVSGLSNHDKVQTQSARKNSLSMMIHDYNFLANCSFHSTKRSKNHHTRPHTAQCELWAVQKQKAYALKSIIRLTQRCNWDAHKIKFPYQCQKSGVWEKSSESLAHRFFKTMRKRQLWHSRVHSCNLKITSQIFQWKFPY